MRREVQHVQRSRGFTLLELMVVVVIIGIVTAGAILSLSVLGSDRELDNETQRLVLLMNYAREQAELQTREFGLYCTQDGYRFLAFDPRTNLWGDIGSDDSLHKRALPDGLTLRLAVEAHDVVLAKASDKKKKTDPQDLVPHIMIFSNGDLTSFELTLARDGTERSSTLVPDDQGRIKLRELPKTET
ncbi:MAG TPA: type II secretion system minor pseudopilin GspH [Steroidobacteraceae bacterium]|nr:type II secretion system minor pseudopilin GspH [Steroidobacteraceae bacterium]